MDKLEGRVAVVTGGASGIGRATAIALARRGVAVVIADVTAASGEAAVAEIKEAEGRAAFVRCDVTSDTAFDELREQTLSLFKRIDIIMNNVGVMTNGRPENIPLAEWRRIIETNLLSVVRSNLAFLPLLMAQKSGHIVNTSSFAGLYTYAFDRMPYAAVKAALVQITEGMAIYLRPLGIGVTLLCPGPVRTNIASSIRSFGEPTELRGPGPMFDLLEPEKVGEMVVDAILTNRFMLPTHPQVRELLVERAQDFDRFLQKQIDHPHLLRIIPKAVTH